MLRALTLAARPAARPHLAARAGARRARAGLPPRATIQPNEPGHDVRACRCTAGRCKAGRCRAGRVVPRCSSPG
eukprot:6273775-Prymnesium_polylepis.1